MPSTDAAEQTVVQDLERERTHYDRAGGMK